MLVRRHLFPLTVLCAVGGSLAACSDSPASTALDAEADAGGSSITDAGGPHATNDADADGPSPDRSDAGDDASSGGPPAVSPPLYGYSAHITRQTDRDAYTALAKNGGAGTIRDDVTWAAVETKRGSYDWTGIDAIVTYAAKNGLRPLLMIGTAPAWASGHSDSWWYLPTHASDYGDFAEAVAKRYGTNGTFWSANPSIPKLLPAGIEIWNEPNLPRFSPGGIDPAKFAAMLADAYGKIKAVDPNLTVVTGGLAPAGGYDDADCNGVVDGGKRNDGAMNGLNFLETVYANGAAEHFDAVGYHPYNFSNGATASGMLSYHVCSAWSQVQDTTPSVRSFMVAHGDSAKKIWATEAGAPTCIAGASYGCVSEAEQANLATQAVISWKSRAFSGNYYWYDLRDDDGGDSTSDEEEHFGAVLGNNKVKPSYAALKNAFLP